MRILWVSAFHEGLHGVRGVVRGLAAALSADHHETAVVTRRPKHLGRRLHRVREPPAGLGVWRVTLRPLSAVGPSVRALPSLLRSCVELRRVVRAERPQVVHVHGMRTLDATGSFAAHVLLLRRLARCPLVLHFHGRPTARTAPSRLDRRAMAEAALVLAPSEDVRTFLEEAFGPTAARTVVFPSGCDPEEFSPAAATDGDSLLAVGRLVPRKGFEVLLDAFARLAPGRPHLRLRLAGDGEERVALEAQATTAGLAERVEFLGALEPTALRERYRRASAVVCPSREDFFPLVILEAMSSGCPVVASRVGAIPSVIEHGVTGLLVPPGDAAALAQALAACLEDAAARRAMGARARAVVCARYSWRALGARLLELYADAGIAVTRHA